MLNNFTKVLSIFYWVVFVGVFGVEFIQAQATSTVPGQTPTVTVTPASQNLNPGQTVTVRIRTTNAEKCTITGRPYNNFNIILNGNILLRPVETTTYVFNCTGKDGKTASTRVSVTVVPLNSPTPNVNSRPVTSPRPNSAPQSNTTSPAPTTSPTQPTQPRQNPAPQNQTQYSTQNSTSVANQLCGQYSNYSSVYNSTSAAGGGGGSVPVDLQRLEPYLVAIDRSNLLIANEIRQQNLYRFCTEYANMARATDRLAATAARTIKQIADNCYADERCMRERVYKAGLEQEIKTLCSDPLYPQELCEMSKVLQGTYEPESNLQAEIEQKRNCNQMWDQGFYGLECIMVEKPFTTLVNTYEASRNRLEVAQNDIIRQYQKSDVMGARPCVETASGRPPEEVRFYEPDCVRWRQEPSIVNQEALRQITALPYTQAFSPSSVLGYDGIIDNINTRARDGNLVTPDISSTFGSSVGAGGGTGGTGGTGTGTGRPGGGTPTVNDNPDLKNVEANYRQITTNIGVIVRLYDVTRLAYASSTSVCRSLPVATRREAINRMDANKRTYTDYLANLKRMWDAAVARPRENHTQLIVKVNFDLKDKYNQTEIDKVYEATRKLLQVCVDAKNGTS